METNVQQIWHATLSNLPYHRATNKPKNKIKTKNNNNLSLS